MQHWFQEKINILLGRDLNRNDFLVINYTSLAYYEHPIVKWLRIASPESY